MNENNKIGGQTKDGLYHAVSGMAFLVRPLLPKRSLRGGLPYLIENPDRECRLILRKEAPVVVGNHFRCVLDGITCLLVRAGESGGAKVGHGSGGIMLLRAE